jgi:CRISPR-associated endonuclease/helicase Cas3
MSASTPSLSDCWAKTDPLTGLPALTVRDHCHTVGFVAQHFYVLLPERLKRLLPDGAVSLVACHDVGKITPGFLLKCSSWKHYSLIASTINRNNLETNHAAVSASHFTHKASHGLVKKARYWLASTAGHHGSYPCGFEVAREPTFEGVDHLIHPLFQQLREELIAILIKSFGPLPKESAKDAEKRVHFLTGFTIFSDWIGSNSDWFPYEKPVQAEAIGTKMIEVVQLLGLNHTIQPSLKFADLFDKKGYIQRFQPRSIQSALINAADAPGLYIVEAPMGMGKTEAALAAAYRRWTEGDERGLYFALPTQLTSERIHERIHQFLENVIEGTSVQSLIHGNAWLKEDHNRQISNGNESEFNDTDEALRWFSSTRKQLLSPFGTGTIDQAMLAVLPARFAALRYFALAGKVVIIDEVHAYDPYMSALIDRLIEYLLPTGATVIILSATLTAARRAEIVKAAGAEEPPAPDSYPLITKVATGSSTATHISTPYELAPKQVDLKHQILTDFNTTQYWQSIADAVERGVNIVIIRNTVALAQETYCLVKSLLRDGSYSDHVGLLHSRFPAWQRLENEKHWVEALGKENEHRPRGSLLVSTQIVEQSVDIDADLLITDIAPTELILQRIGRLHRHERSRPEGFESACCDILYPDVDWGSDEKLILQALTPHHYIYPASSLWQAMETLGKRKKIQLPQDIRPLIEASVFQKPQDSHSQPIHEFFSAAQQELDEKVGKAKTRGVFMADAIEDKEGTETRYGMKPSALVVLLKNHPQENGDHVTLTPLHGAPITFSKYQFNPRLAKALNENTASVPAYLLSEALKDAPSWLTNHLSDGVLAVVSMNSTTLEVLTDNLMKYTLYYRTDLGITHTKNAELRFTTDPEDFYF